MTDKVKLCLWFNGDAEEAANFYVSLLPDSRIDAVNRSPADYPAGKAGDVLTVEFTLAGRQYVGLNGGAGSPFTQALSLQVECEDQAEVDRLWEAMVANGAEPVACSWITDRWGLSWQITPRALSEMIASPDRAAAARAMQAMMTMVKIDLPTLQKAFAGER
ncbi:MAG TPA: VOC family protein [Allosphingosinicella sp.]|jgi:2-polyprenyl-6-hydroxyphenyl methylase/3-demethylubiquinone-9 3-methyltransferase